MAAVQQCCIAGRRHVPFAELYLFMFMIDARKAAILARASAPEGFVIAVDQARESRCGWFFPWRLEDDPAAGSKGVVVDKQTGRVVTLGSAYSLDRDLNAFDAGYRFGPAFLVVTAVRNERTAIEQLMRLRIREVTPEFAHGVQWKIPKSISVQDIKLRLGQLPCKFGPIATYFAVEALEAMKLTRDISFELEEVSS